MELFTRDARPDSERKGPSKRVPLTLFTGDSVSGTSVGSESLLVHVDDRHEKEVWTYSPVKKPAVNIVYIEFLAQPVSE